MEVHHHPNVEKKKFKEYFLEFLMIFLAVTLGFVAENIRENISKNKRERHLMVQMAEDLRRDTADIRIHIQITQKKIDAFDTLINLVFRTADKKLQDSLIKKMYALYSQYSKGWSGHIPTGRTLNQLDKEGGFSIIRKSQVADSILKYKDLNEISIVLSDRFRARQEDARLQSQNIFNYETFWSEDSINEFKWPSKLALLTNDFKTLNIYAAKLCDALIVLHTYLDRLEVKERFADHLIDMIVMQYHLKQP